MSKTFEMTISRLRFSELSLSDHNYFRPTRARGPRSTTTSHILKRSTYFAIIGVDSTVAVPILSSPCQFGIFVLIRKFFVLLALGSTIVAHVAKSHNYVNIGDNKSVNPLLGFNF